MSQLGEQRFENPQTVNLQSVLSASAALHLLLSEQETEGERRSAMVCVCVCVCVGDHWRLLLSPVVQRASAAVVGETAGGSQCCHGLFAGEEESHA